MDCVCFRPAGYESLKRDRKLINRPVETCLGGWMNKLKGRKTVFERLSCFSWFRFIRWIESIEDATGDDGRWKEESVSRRGENNSRPVGALRWNYQPGRSIKLVKIFRALWRFAVNYDGKRAKFPRRRRRRCLIKTPRPRAASFREKFRRRCHRKSPVSLFRVKLVRRYGEKNGKIYRRIRMKVRKSRPAFFLLWIFI